MAESNIGSKLLQKMGWQAGAALGNRPSNGESDTNSIHESIRKDWDRIEDIAGSQRRGPASAR